VQSIIDLPDGSGLTLTTARYFTPSGRSIQRDYSTGNLYDYYNHRGVIAAKGTQATTASHRTVFGGDGIEPDEEVETPKLTRWELELLDPLFFFMRASVNPQNAEQQKRISLISSSGEIDEAMMIQFSDFAAAELPQLTPSSLLEAERAFIRTRFRFSLMMAGRGATAANRILISSDPQVARAAEALPRARQLAMASKRPPARQ
jgi:carboxyl-terminal processing protease